MLEGELRRDLFAVQHGRQHIGLFNDVLVITASEVYLQVGELQFHAPQVFTDMQHLTQESPLGTLEHLFGIFGPGLGGTPAVSHNDGSAGVGSRPAAVTVRHTADGQHRVIHIVLQGLRLALIQFLHQVFDLARQLWVDIPILQRAFLFQIGVVGGGNIDVMEEHQRLNELFHAINAIALRVVDSVQQRQHDLKCAQTSGVEGIFDDRQTQNLRLAFLDLREISDLEIMIFGVDAIYDNAVLTLDVLNVQHRRFA